ncbi:26 kDa periplasmic immunogenic protein precursor [Chlamydia abortus]|uniref:SIMPL domain-containing protein n=1 Tax=Paenibacillus residui TaxID=629724 RepID=A0ABW3D790_9BACL|nr:26 kDa periplasmic immunogenic protein precursor [Chlamydia abortus]
MYGYPMNKFPFRTPSPSVIEVLGEGALQAPPDQALIVLGAVSEGPVLQTVQSENAGRVTNIIQALQQLQIPQQKIQTSDYRIEAQYDYPEGQSVFRGYKVTHLLQISTGKVEQTGAIVDTAVAHGANIVTGIRFTLAHPERYSNEALSLAVRDARRKAAALARALGVSLAAVPGKVQELSRSVEPLFYQAPMLAESAATPIQPGELTVRASVRVWYSFA